MPDARSVGPDAKPAPQAAERRRWVRYPQDLTLVCRVFGRRSRDWKARAWDVSAAGLSLLCDRPLPGGTILAVRPTSWGARPPLLVCVRHSTEAGDEWLLGCGFVVAPSDDVLRALLP